MAWPEVVKTRVVFIPEATILEDGTDLRIRAKIKASRSLINAETGYRMESLFVRTSSSLGERLSFELPTTDMSGWKDSKTGEEILIEDSTQYTHTYTACVQLVTDHGVLVGEPFDVGPFIVPTWNNVFDEQEINLYTALRAGTTEGEQVIIPPDWTNLIEGVLPPRIQSDTDQTVLSDMHSVTKSGWYRSKSDTLNVPYPNTLYYAQHIAGEDGMDGVLIAHGYDGSYKNIAFVASKIDGVWSSWSSLGTSAGSYPLMEDPDDEGTYLITSPNDVVEDVSDPGFFLVVS